MPIFPRVSNGNITRAIELCENEDSSLANLDRFKSLMRFAWKRDIISIISWSEEMATTGREAQKNFISFSLRILRENLMLSLDQLKNNLVFLAGEEAAFSGNFHPLSIRIISILLPTSLTWSIHILRPTEMQKSFFLILP